MESSGLELTLAFRAKQAFCVKPGNPILDHRFAVQEAVETDQWIRRTRATSSTTA